MRTSELQGAELDYWVSQAEGIETVLWANEGPPDQAACILKERRPNAYPAHYQPSSNWAHGGSIIERENIHLSPPTSRVHRNGGPNAGWGPSGVWSACTWHLGANGRRAIGHHETSPLIAAMRCYVMSTFGDTVADIPK